MGFAFERVNWVFSTKEAFLFIINAERNTAVENHCSCLCQCFHLTYLVPAQLSSLTTFPPPRGRRNSPIFARSLAPGRYPVRVAPRIIRMESRGGARLNRKPHSLALCTYENARVSPDARMHRNFRDNVEATRRWKHERDSRWTEK